MVSRNPGRRNLQLQFPDISGYGCDNFFVDLLGEFVCPGFEQAQVDQNCKAAALASYETLKNAAVGEYNDEFQRAVIAYEIAMRGLEAYTYGKAILKCGRLRAWPLIAACLAREAFIIETRKAAIKELAEAAFEAAKDNAVEILEAAINFACTAANIAASGCISCPSEPSWCPGSLWSCGQPASFCQGRDYCGCDLTTNGRSLCVQNVYCGTTPYCSSDSQCPSGWGCLRNTCCGSSGVCAPPCNGFRRDLAEEPDFSHHGLTALQGYI